ncbi:mitochondrion organization and biogenesis protein [Colletotrichum musicola]|uniref:Required for respiratory growth protein 9, mitochondrial n=1 Tax=Colletotrichum musicola TaxID=2175873 RepID=A0A8H6NN84_9PEZI|nr:mitochondrion organization and biogenesis protein [Colletotrichum musicola]
MACACRQSPLRLFVQGMSQLHITETAATRLPLRPAITRTHRTFQTVHQNPFSTTTLIARGHDWAVVQAKEKKSKPKKQDREGVTATKAVKEAGATKRKRKVKADKDAAPAATGAAEIDNDAAPAAPAASQEAKPKREKEPWMIQKEALKQKFPEGWKPLKRLSPDAIAGIRALHAQFPDEYTTRQLSNMFEVSPEAIRRILRSKWRATPEEEQERQERWFRRGVSVWSRFAELGVKPPQKWRREGVARDPSFHDNRKAAIEKRKEREMKEKEREEDKEEKLQRKLGDSIL